MTDQLITINHFTDAPELKQTRYMCAVCVSTSDGTVCHTPIRQNTDTVCVVCDLIRLLNTQIRSSSLYTDQSYHILEHIEVKL